MGNCFTCFKIPPATETTNSLSIQRENEDIMEGKHLFNCSTELHRHSFSSLDHQSNGSTKFINCTADNVGSLHRDKSLRTFYSRIQPLTRNTTTCPNNNDIKQKEVNDGKLLSLFECYRDSEAPDLILPEGMEKLLQDLSLSPDEFRVLVLAWKLNAEHMCQFTKDEFVNGLKSMHVDSIRSLSNKLNDITNEVLNNSELFKDLYRFTFRFGLDKFSGQRLLPTDVAICMWRVVFSMKEPPLLDRWLKFLECHPNVRGIPRDTWHMFLNLTETLDSDLSLYDDSEAWPSVFDDFVEYENDTVNQNICPNKESTCLHDCV